MALKQANKQTKRLKGEETMGNTKQDVTKKLCYKTFRKVEHNTYYLTDLTKHYWQCSYIVQLWEKDFFHMSEFIHTSMILQTNHFTKVFPHNYYFTIPLL